MGLVEHQFRVLFKLLMEVRKSAPHCLIVPFGSVITGLATKHSDSDLCLVPRPPAALVRVLTGDSYFSPSLLTLIGRLEGEYGVPLCPPPSPPSVEVDRFTVPTNLTALERTALFGPVLKELGRHLHKMEDCSQVMTIPHARCPIIRFMHNPSALHFDICIDNM